MTSEIWQQIDQFLYKLVFVFSYVGGWGGGVNQKKCIIYCWAFSWCINREWVHCSSFSLDLGCIYWQYPNSQIRPFWNESPRAEERIKFSGSFLAGSRTTVLPRHARSCVWLHFAKLSLQFRSKKLSIDTTARFIWLYRCAIQVLARSKSRS